MLASKYKEEHRGRKKQNAEDAPLRKCRVRHADSAAAPVLVMKKMLLINRVRGFNARRARPSSPCRPSLA